MVTRSEMRYARTSLACGALAVALAVARCWDRAPAARQCPQTSLAGSPSTRCCTHTASCTAGGKGSCSHDELAPLAMHRSRRQISRIARGQRAACRGCNPCIGRHRAHTASRCHGQPTVDSATPCIEFVTTTDGHGCARANVRVEHWLVRSARGLPAMSAVGKGMGPHRWPGVSVLAPRSCAMADAPSHSCCRKSSTAVPARHTRKWRSPLGCALSVRTRDDATAH